MSVPRYGSQCICIVRLLSILDALLGHDWVGFLNYLDICNLGGFTEKLSVDGQSRISSKNAILEPTLAILLRDSGEVSWFFLSHKTIVLMPMLQGIMVGRIILISLTAWLGERLAIVVYTAMAIG